MTKQCTKCNENKPIIDFHKSKQSKDGLKSSCKTCRRTESTTWYKASGGAYDKEKTLMSKYGLTLEVFTTMLSEQHGVCKLCKLPESEKEDDSRIRYLAVDHSHKNGKVRGLLCAKCNRGLGSFGDDPTLLRAAADYIEEFNL